MATTISAIIGFLETLAPPALQEGYDNSGLLTGDPTRVCTGVLTTLDATEAVVEEARQKGCNLIVAHHPIVFSGLKRLSTKDYVARTLILAIRYDIALYAIHTNLDNVLHGVNATMADALGLLHRRVLLPKPGTLKKLYTFVPPSHAEAVRKAIFLAGGGHIGQYRDCSFSAAGEGRFTGLEGTNPFTGEPGIPHTEPEIKTEILFPAWLEPAIVQALRSAHPYEEPAYDIIRLDNTTDQTGSGLLGELPEPMSEKAFLANIKTAFGLSVIRHTPLLDKPIQRVALCGGAGSFLVRQAIAAGAHCYLTGDVKYHEFFDADGQLLFADIGHFESEQFTIGLLHEVLQQKFPTFAVLKTEVCTNPVHYFL
jgi:dinuclear metal center YbgI/SA1388 family protein